MPFHSYNHGVVTSGKGVAYEAFAVPIGGSGAPGTVSQSSSNLIASVAHPATGRYVFTLNLPYPPRLVVCIPHIATASPVGAVALQAVYLRDSYNPATGVFEIQTTDLETPALTDPASGDDLMVVMVFDRYTKVT